MARYDRILDDIENRLEKNTKPRRSAVRRKQLKELKEQRKAIFRSIHESRYNEQVELRKQLHELEAAMEDLHGDQGHQRHSNPFERSLDFKHYYKHMQRMRFAFLFVNVALWGLLFALSGPATGFKVVVLVVALVTTVSNVFELLFLFGVKKRIMSPVDDLKKGVAEIMKGNFTVVVDPYSHSEISELIDSFNDMAKKLYDDERLAEEYERNRKLLIANISHDLKTPITSIQGYIEAIGDRKDLSGERLEKYLSIIHSNAQYMNRLIDDLFLFSKLDMQKLEFDFSVVDFRRYLMDLMVEFRLELAERHAELNYADALQGGALARIDPKRFHQVVRNIIDNAVKYGPGTGLRIEARLTKQSEALRLDLSDNGPGIPEDQLDRVFERFFRLDAERTKDTGSTGLGLAIAKEFVAAHGGDIAVRSKLGEGACFTITLPQAKEVKNEEHPDH